MTIAISDELRELHDVAIAFLQRARAAEFAHALLDVSDEPMPPYWQQMADLGWLGLHVPEEYGGSGFGLAELAVVTEAMGRCSAAGPFLPTVWTSAVLVAAGHEEQRQRLLPGLVDGAQQGAVGVDELHGVVLGASHADVLLLPVGDDLMIAYPDEVSVKIPSNVDRTRRSAVVRLKPQADLNGRMLRGARSTAVALGRALAAAEASGGAQRCLDMSVDYAKTREQFGRVIGTFQAVKHHAADMMVALQLASSATWDAVRVDPASPEFQLAAAIAASQSLRGFTLCAELNIQIHGGIGYTWEHHAHVLSKRALAVQSVFGPLAAIEIEIADREAAGGISRTAAVGLPLEAESYRAEIRQLLSDCRGLRDAERATALLDSGYMVSHWPRPWGRSATAVEQLVVEEELAAEGIDSLDFGNRGIGGWILQTIIEHASPDQIARWVRPSLEGKHVWCQMFSEPNAGSDAAAIRTVAERVDGGWLVTGQKVWTSGATWSDWGLMTVRTDSSGGKHQGITMMALDLRAEGVEIRPIRDASGREAFAEVFLDRVHVPDSDVIGGIGEGWRVARSTLGNERVSIGKSIGDREMMFELIDVYRRHALGDPAAAAAVGQQLAEARSLDLLNIRTVARAVAGGKPGPESSIAKLLIGEHVQRTAAVALQLIGAAGAFTEGPDARVPGLFVRARSYTIAGGTSEILRNQIAERLLGLPRDPLIR